MDSEFTETLIDAFMGRRPERRIIGAHANLRRDILAVARVALERAAEAVKSGGDVGRLSPETSTNRAFNRGLDAAEEIIRALIPDEVEGSLPVEGKT